MENQLEVYNAGPKQVDVRSIEFGDAVASLQCLLSSTSEETFVEVLAPRPKARLQVWCLFVLRSVFLGTVNLGKFGALGVKGLFLERLRCLFEKVIPIRYALDPYMAFKREGIGVLAKIPDVGNRFVPCNAHPTGEYLSGLWLG